MKYIIAVLVFFMVFFVYIHVFFHLKTSNDLEIYDIEDAPSKDKLEEICDLRQPVLFDYNMPEFNAECNYSEIMNKYSAFDVKIRNINKNDDKTDLYVHIALGAMEQLFSNDNENQYISEKNIDFLEETSLVKLYRYNDIFLRPPMVSSCMYDIQFASNKCRSIFRYDLNYRNFYMVTDGMVRVKLTPPKSKKYLYLNSDYENFEFSSPINPWDVQDCYKADFRKIKCLEITLEPGKMLFIPAYWWYSFEFTPKTSLCAFKYKTYMNNVAIIPENMMQILQSQNVKRNIVKKINNT